MTTSPRRLPTVLAAAVADASVPLPLSRWSLAKVMLLLRPLAITLTSALLLRLPCSWVPRFTPATMATSRPASMLSSSSATTVLASRHQSAI